jgi:hypothetical protein
VTVLGLVSDTHVPDYCPALPTAVLEALRGVDLILHAGDVGDLGVLDQLGAVAPVVAVHGNDDSPAAQATLPYQQLVVASGQRVLLCHTHLPDPAEEAASRAEDRWEPKLDRRAAMAHRAGAGVIVFGHSHVPMAVEHQGVLLVNPGAIAPPGPLYRQRRRTVARLFLAARTRRVEHADIADPSRTCRPSVDWSAGFRAASQAAVASILEPALAANWDRLARELGGLVPPAIARDVLIRAAHRVWAGEREFLALPDLLAELEAEQRLPEHTRRRVLALATDARG